MDFDPRDIDSRDRDDFNIYDERWLDDPRDLDDRGAGSAARADPGLRHLVGIHAVDCLAGRAAYVHVRI